MVNGLPLTKGGRRGASPTALMCQPRLQTGAAVCMRKPCSDLRRRQVTPEIAEKQLDPPLESDGLCSFYKSEERPPFSKSALQGCCVALKQTRWKSWVTEGIPSTWHVLKSLWLWGLAFGAWKMRRKRINVLALPSFHTKPEIQNQRAGSWVSGHPSAWWYFHKKIFPKPQGDPM